MALLPSAAAYTIGTLERNTLGAPGIIWPQTSVQKNWMLRERLRLTLRGDINNISFGTFGCAVRSLTVTAPTDRRRAIGLVQPKSCGYARSLLRYRNREGRVGNPAAD